MPERFVDRLNRMTDELTPDELRALAARSGMREQQTPPPGSAEAVKRGCRCPRDGNVQWMHGDYRVQADNTILHKGCPLHWPPGEPKPQAQRGEG